MRGLLHSTIGLPTLASAIILAAASQAGAQTAERNGPSGAGAGVLEEIVITAERRTQSLQDVPIAASVLSGSDLGKKAVQQLEDLQFVVPSISITDQGLTQSVNIRGIGLSSGSPQVANGVATYVDGLFQPPIVTTNNFYDIASIEVLRGPQGTLVGSNATGGAMFINSQNPNLDAFEGHAQAEYGNYDKFGAQGAVNLPLSDTLAVRAAGLYQHRDSFYEDLGPFDNKPDRLNEKSGRLGLLWHPGSFQALAKVQLSKKESGGYAYRPIPGTTFAAGRTSDLREIAYDSPTKNDERALISSLELKYELDGGIILRSLSGFQNKRINNLYDMDGTTLTTMTMDQYVRERQWSQEFNIISPTTGKLNWILGGYYQRNKIDVDILQLDNGFPTDILVFTDKITTGLFAQAGYYVVPDVEVQVGARYSHFKSEGSGGVFIGNGIPTFPPGGQQVADLAGDHKDGRATGKVALNWHVDDDSLLYAFVARGYKPGGFNSTVSEFGPETVTDYEAGWKSTLLNSHLRTQLGVFYSDYKDFQFDALDPSTAQIETTNVAGATVKGVEAQVQVQVGGFQADANVGYVDSDLEAVMLVNNRLLPPGQLGPQCPAGTPSSPPVCFDYGPFTQEAGGGPNLFSPKWTFNIGAEYAVFVDDRTTLTPRLNYGYISSRYTNLFYNPQTDLLMGRDVVSGLLTLQRDDWQLQIYGTNLTNEKYVTGQSGNSEFYGAPREYGVRVSARF